MEEKLMIFLLNIRLSSYMKIDNHTDPSSEVYIILGLIKSRIRLLLMEFQVNL